MVRSHPVSEHSGCLCGTDNRRYCWLSKVGKDAMCSQRVYLQAAVYIHIYIQAEKSRL